MRALICNERFLFRFGLDRVLILLAKGLRGHGHHVTVMGNRYDGPVLTSLADRIIDVPIDGAEYLNLNEYTMHWLQSNWQTFFDNKEIPDIIIVGGWPFLAAIPFFRKTGAGVVFIDCGAVPLDGYGGEALVIQKKLRRLRQTYLRDASRIIAISDFIAVSQSRPDCNGEVPVDVVPLGADHMTMSLWSCEGVGVETVSSSTLVVDDFRRRGYKTILSLGRWETHCYKNVEAVFDVMKRLRKSFPECVLFVLDSPGQVNVPYRLRDNVCPIGFPDDRELKEIMEMVDLAVCPSLWEGFNLPLAEMQWVEKPALVFDTGAHPEVIVHPWYLCRSSEEMAEKACHILSGTGLSEPVLKSVQKEFKQYFRWDRVIADYRAILDDVQRHAEAESTMSARRGGNRPLVIVDVTNAATDPANSGVVRVTRRLCRELQKYVETWFVVRDSRLQQYVFPTRDQYEQLGQYNGPRLTDNALMSTESETITLVSHVTAPRSRPCWLILAEIVPDEDGAKIRRMARANNMMIGAIFYDAIPVLAPELCRDDRIRENHGAYMKGLAECDVVIPISGFSSLCLDDFWRNGGVRGTTLLPDQLPGEFGGFPRDRRALFSLPEKIQILCVSTLEPRKNHRCLVRACLRMEKEHPDLDWSLVLVGNRYAGAFDIADEIESVARANTRIRWLGIVDDDSLHGLYKTTTFTVYPSVIEGFGMPIVESIWHGKPCVCHEEGVMGELAADGGCLTTDVTNEIRLSEALYALATDNGLFASLSMEAVRRPMRTWSEYVFDFLRALDTVTGEKERVAIQAGGATCHDGLVVPERAASAMVDHDTLPRWELKEFLRRYRPRRCLYVGRRDEDMHLLAGYSENVVVMTDRGREEILCPGEDKISYCGISLRDEFCRVLDETTSDGCMDMIFVRADCPADDLAYYLEALKKHIPRSPFFLIVAGDSLHVLKKHFVDERWTDCRYVDFVKPDFMAKSGVGPVHSDDEGLSMVYFTPFKRGRRVIDWPAGEGGRSAPELSSSGRNEEKIDVCTLISSLTVEDLIETAEKQYRRFGNDLYLLSKPLTSIDEAPSHLTMCAVLLRGLRLLNGMVVLDFGAGGCYFSRMLNQLGCEVISLDVSSTALEYGKKLATIHPVIGDQPDHRFMIFDGHRIDLPDESVDRIACMDSFHHIPNPEQILGEMFRVLRKDGIAGFSEPGPTHSESPEAQAQMKTYKVIENDIVVEHIFEIARKVGFADIRLAVYGTKPYLVTLDEYNSALRNGFPPLGFTGHVMQEIARARNFYLYKGNTADIIYDSSVKDGLKAKIEIACDTRTVGEGESLTFRGVVENISEKIWLPSGSKRGSVNLGVHLIRRDDLGAERDYKIPLSSCKVFPGVALEVVFDIPAPEKGCYTFTFDLVSEFVTWFEWTGSKTVILDIEVKSTSESTRLGNSSERDES